MLFWELLFRILFVEMYNKGKVFVDTEKIYGKGVL